MREVTKMKFKNDLKTRLYYTLQVKKKNTIKV